MNTAEVDVHRVLVLDHVIMVDIQPPDTGGLVPHRGWAVRALVTGGMWVHLRWFSITDADGLHHWHDNVYVRAQQDAESYAEDLRWCIENQ